jgi:hypothetical protein
VTRLDRLARSTRDLLNILDDITKRGAGLKSMADVWADTTTPHGRPMLTVLGGLAEFERELIKSRTGEGRRRPYGPARQVVAASAARSRCRRDAGEALMEGNPLKVFVLTKSFLRRFWFADH